MTTTTAHRRCLFCAPDPLDIHDQLLFVSSASSSIKNTQYFIIPLRDHYMLYFVRSLSIRLFDENIMTCLQFSLFRGILLANI